MSVNGEPTAAPLAGLLMVIPEDEVVEEPGEEELGELGEFEFGDVLENAFEADPQPVPASTRAASKEMQMAVFFSKVTS